MTHSERYQKEWTSVDQQIERLESRGLIVEDRDTLANALQAIGYYRLTGYTYPFRTSSGGVVGDRFREGTRQEQVLALYDFDRRLKLTIMDAIERMEIGFRFSVAYTLGKSDKYGHLHRSSLDRTFTRRQVGGSRYDEWHVKYLRDVRQSKEEFVQHFKRKYEGGLPIWIAVELMSLARLSELYGGLAYSDRVDISRHYGIGKPGVVASWLHCLTYVRNVCAHHGRLWNRNMDRRPAVSPRGESPSFDHLVKSGQLVHGQSRIYAPLLALRHFLQRIEQDPNWELSMLDLLKQLPVGGPVQHGAMGFPDGWQEFWPGND